MVKFGELGVHKVSLLSLESTRKKKIHISKCPANDDASYKFMSWNLFFLFSFWSDATFNKLLSAKSLALANINI